MGAPSGSRRSSSYMNANGFDRHEDFKGALLIILLGLCIWYAVASLGPAWTPLFWAVVIAGVVFGLRIRWARPVAYVIGALAVVWFFSTIWKLLFPFLAAFAIAYLVSPVVTALEKRRIPRGLSAFLLIILAIGALAGIIVLVVPPIVEQITTLVAALSKVPRQLEDLVVAANQKLATLEEYEISPYAKPALDNLILRIQNLFADLFEKALKFLTSFSSLATHIVNIIIVPIITFYLLRDMPKIQAWVRARIPLRYVDEATAIYRDIDRVLAGWIRGQFLLSSLEAAFIALGLTIIGIPYSLLLGIFAGFANMIPYVGTYVGATPAIIVALLSDNPTPKVLWALGLFVFVNLFDAYILAPRIVGRRVGLHPVIAMIAMLVGAKFFGVIGFLAAVPVTGVLRIIGLRLEDRYFQGKYFKEPPRPPHPPKNQTPEAR